VGHAAVDDPSILIVKTAQAIFHPESLAGIEGIGVCVQAAFEIVGMDTLCPAVAQLAFQRPAGEFKPPLVEPGAAFVRAGHPEHNRGRVAHQAEAIFIFMHRRVRGRHHVIKALGDDVQSGTTGAISHRGISAGA